MDASAAEFEQGVMKHNGKQSEQLQKQMEALYQNLRTVRTRSTTTSPSSWRWLN